MKQKKAIIHGECIIFESKVPQDAILEEQDKSFVIIANSEVTGNHHVIDRPSNAVQFFTKDKKRYMRNSQPTNVRCVIADRHTSIPIPAGDWEIGIQQEYDYIAQVKRNVQD